MANMSTHQIKRGWTKWECSCGEQFVTKRDADAHAEEAR